jgi:hypothetical protein
VGIAAAFEANLRERCRDRLLITGSQMVDATRAACSRREGTLADSIEIDSWSEEGDRYTTTIRATAEHARFQDEGTGIYGPEGTPIYPTSGKVLRFDWPAAGGVVFFAHVAGSPGTHFFTEPMPQRYSDALNASW